MRSHNHLFMTCNNKNIVLTCFDFLVNLPKKMHSFFVFFGVGVDTHKMRNSDLSLSTLGVRRSCSEPLDALGQNLHSASWKGESTSTTSPAHLHQATMARRPLPSKSKPLKSCFAGKEGAKDFLKELQMDISWSTWGQPVVHWNMTEKSGKKWKNKANSNHFST